jgi:hypothetical protein
MLGFGDAAATSVSCHFSFHPFVPSFLLMRPIDRGSAQLLMMLLINDWDADPSFNSLRKRAVN